MGPEAGAAHIFQSAALVDEIIDSNGLRQMSDSAALEAIIDTGFSGFLTLPPSTVASLSLAWLGREQGILADGRAELFDVFRAEVNWDGQPRAGAASTLASHVSLVRKLIGAERLESRAGAYRLQAELGVERDGGRRQRERPVAFRLGELLLPEEDVAQAQQPQTTRPGGPSRGRSPRGPRSASRAAGDP